MTEDAASTTGDLFMDADAQAAWRYVQTRRGGHGFAALAINTRQHDEKRNTDNFFESSRDIDAAVQTAKALGYYSIVLQGHSLGTLQVLFYAATNWDRDIKAVVQLSTSVARGACCRARPLN